MFCSRHLRFRYSRKSTAPTSRTHPRSLLARRPSIIGIGRGLPGAEPGDDARQLAQALDDKIRDAWVVFLSPFAREYRTHPQALWPLHVLTHSVANEEGV